MIRLLSRRESGHPRAGRRGFVLPWVLLAAVGCGGNEGEVTGTVTYRDKPVPNGVVTFLDTDNKVVGTSSIAEGKYTMRRVPPGVVKITVASTPVSPPAAAGATEQPAAVEGVALPPRYDSPDESGLTYEVKPGRQEHAIDLK